MTQMNELASTELRRHERPYPSFLDHILHLLNSGILVVPSEIVENAEGSDLSASISPCQSTNTTIKDGANVLPRLEFCKTAYAKL